MDDEIEKKLFTDEKEEENIDEIVDKFIKIGKVTFDGKTILNPELNKRLNREEILGVQIVGKILASMIRKEIKPQITIKELFEWNKLIIPNDQVMARVNDLIKKGIIVRMKRGIFQARPYYIKYFIGGIIEKYKL
ncbi:hypothetical protein KAT24_00365 [Candidatus Pacearchaeota archaeon]|nr:hypothetical protein [Candidatus Pacearchaeota archaeon]